MGRRQKWQTTARIYHNNGVSELMGKDGWCWCIQVADRCGVLLLIQRILTIFCRPFQRSCAGSAKWTRSIAGTQRYTYSLQTTPSRVSISSRSVPSPPTVPSKPGRSFVPPLATRSPALSEPPICTQWPVPQAFLRGMPNSSTSHASSSLQRPPCSLMPQSRQHLPHCGAPCTDTAGC
jgi:hypothetical protein